MTTPAGATQGPTRISLTATMLAVSRQVTNSAVTVTNSGDMRIVPAFAHNDLHQSGGAAPSWQQIKEQGPSAAGRAAPLPGAGAAGRTNARRRGAAAGHAAPTARPAPRRSRVGHGCR